MSCGRSNNNNLEPPVYNPQLPAITTSGSNTLGCKINGVVMIPRNSIGFVGPFGSNHYACSYSRGSNYEFEAFGGSDLRPETNKGGIDIYLQNNPVTGNSTAIGNHSIYNAVIYNGFNLNYKDFIIITKSGSNVQYFSIENTGNIVITKSDNNIISGTFSCKAQNENNPNDIIEITEGRFDFNKNTINTTNFP